MASVVAPPRRYLVNFAGWLLAAAFVATACSSSSTAQGGATGGVSSGGANAGGLTTRGGSQGSSDAGAGGAKSSAGGSKSSGSGGSPAQGGDAETSGGRETTGGAASANGGAMMSGGAGNALGAFPYTPSTVTRGGTMTFTNVGAKGWWPRRIDRAAGDPACDYKDGTDTWGAHCCMKQQQTETTTLAPFDEEMTLILKAIVVKQLAVYQPRAGANASYERVTAWDQRTNVAENLWFTQKGAGAAQFPGDLSRNDCVGYLTQAPLFDCGDGKDYFCPDDPGVLHRGFSGSKLIVFLGSMSFEDAGVKSCDGNGSGSPAPWVAFVASELVRDGGRKWNGACNCYSKTGTVGDGCGEINVFEVVMDNNEYSNREFASTGVRSFQAGHVGGSVCQASCDRAAFPADVEVVDACAKKAYQHGPAIAVDGASDGCPVWRRPDGDRYFFILLDESARTIQVGIVHPGQIPSALTPLLPELPGSLSRAAIDGILALRLPE